MEGSRRITRSALLEVKMIPTSKIKKNVKFEDHDATGYSSAQSDKTERRFREETSSFEESGKLEEALFSSLTPSYILKSRHLLAHSWTFWYSAGNKDLTWQENQTKICSVNTVEDFWFILKQVQSPSNIPAGYTYSVFRGDILPDWEDVNNKNGGRWMVSFPKSQRQEMLDTRWMDVLIMIMGDQGSNLGSEHVTGAEVCVRKKGDRLEVWVADVDMKVIVEVGREMRKRLKLDPRGKIQFSIHEEEIEGRMGLNLVL